MVEQQRHRLVVNVLSNYITLGLYIVTHFILVGYIIRKLGKDVFGLVTLAMSLTVIMELLGRAVSYALTKHLSAEIVKKENSQANEFINTSLAWFLLCASVGGIGCGIVANYVERLFDIPPALIRDARWAMWLIALRIFVCLPFSTFQGVLFAYQRYDLTNLSKAVTLIIHFFAVICYFQFVSAGIIPFVIITTIFLVAERLLWLLFSMSVAEDLRIKISLISRRAMTALFGFGGFIMVIYVANILAYEATKWVIGLELTVADVGGYSLIASVAVAGTGLVRSISTVLMPVASKYDALQQHDRNARLTLLATKYTMIVSSAMFLMPLLLLKPLLTLWISDQYMPEYIDLLARAGVILLLGEWFVTTVVCILQILSGVGRIRFPATVTLSWAVSGLGGVWAYLHWSKRSLLGAVVVITITRIIGTVVHMIYGLNSLKIPPKRMLLDSILRPGSAGVGACIISYFLLSNFNVYKPISFLLAVGALICVYSCLVWTLVLCRSERTSIIQGICSIVSRKSHAVKMNTVKP